MNVTAYGLTFHLPFPCPELPPAHPSVTPDVAVIEGHVPRQLSGTLIQTNSFDADSDRFLLRGGTRAGRFLVEGGNRITFDRNPAGEDSVIAVHFLHTVLAALLHQRGCLVLHASAVLINGGAEVVSGETGAGKSTLLAALAARGFPVVSDDVTAIRPLPDGGLEVIPGPQWIHLCEDAAARLSLQSAGLRRETWRRVKVAVPSPGAIPREPPPFRRLVILAPSTGDRLRVTGLSGSRKLQALIGCVFMPMFAEEQAERFPLMEAVMSRVPALSIERPAGKWTVDEIVESLLTGGIPNG